jgi:hypothetical protein
MNKHARPPAAQPATYETDVHQWAVEQAALLRAGRFDRLDLENIAEEIDSVGRSEKREIESRLEVLLVHLLKWRFQPEKRKGGWQASIRVQRKRLRIVLSENASLAQWPGQQLGDVYSEAVLAAVEETGLDFETFPEACPFTIDEIMDEAFPPA